MDPQGRLTALCEKGTVTRESAHLSLLLEALHSARVAAVPSYPSKMASLVKAVFGSSPPSTDSPLAKNHSFNDLSMGAQDHLEESYNAPAETSDPKSPTAGAADPGKTTWSPEIHPVLTPAARHRYTVKEEVQIDVGGHL